MTGSGQPPGGRVTCISRWEREEGSVLPFGASWVEADQAYNFALYSAHAHKVQLLLYGPDDFATPIFVYDMNPHINKWRQLWHCRVPAAEIPKARYYAYHVDGPDSSEAPGFHSFDPEKVLLDPFASAVFFPPAFDRKASMSPGSNAGKAPLGILPQPQEPFDWGDDRSPCIDYNTVIYELHVRGFTMSPTSGVTEAKRGTFAGLIEKIPHLQDLGVTAVELMPVHQYDPEEGNYWGYMTLNFFAPHTRYAWDKSDAAREFKEMVKALHQAGIQVLLDVVYNHTAEGNADGPNYSFKGIDNDSYYLMRADSKDPYWNFSGTGNTTNCNHAAVRVLILESLRYWVQEMHVDGFRFDLASAFTRNEDGSANWSDPPLITAIRTDPVLREVRLIAEPWDADGLYQLGSSFPGLFWHQWNGKFRDDLRRLVRGDGGMVGVAMQRLYGSDDLFTDEISQSCRPWQSINYICSHDGFTMYDQVSYNERHNAANGHGNTDGHQDNLSWNCGWEGDDQAPQAVLSLRKQQVKNFATLLFLSNGLPMFCAGDEFMQTQGGNNNPYNQDNQTSWLNWSRLEANQDIFRFFKLMIRLRNAHPSICRSRFWREDVHWYGQEKTVDFSSGSRSFAYCLHGEAMGDEDIYVMINMSAVPLEFHVQEGSVYSWRLAVDTSQPAPGDISAAGSEPPLSSMSVTVAARSIVVLVGDAD